MRLWRLTHRQFQKTAFTGEGSYAVGGRWIPAGCRAVYASQSLSLCVLELLVHVEVRHIMDNFVAFPIDVPQDLVVERVSEDALPRDWRSRHAWAKLQSIGAEWLRTRHSSLLQVPSAVVPQESNFLLNPAHPDFGRLVLGKPEPYRFDPRLGP